MVELASYDDAIVHTLRKRAVQSAILIDDSFPTYRDLLDAEDAGAVQRDWPDASSAKQLYDFLHGQRIVCDVENRIDQIDGEFLEKVRKSDLVVLDWNLRRGDETDSDDAVKVLDGLSRTPHFNLVVIYTRVPDLVSVWTRAAIRLHGGWRSKEQFADGLDLSGFDLDELFEELDPDGSVLAVSDEMLRGYVLKGMQGVDGWKQIKHGLVQKGLDKDVAAALVEALVHRAAINRHFAATDDSAPRRIDGRHADAPFFLTVGSVFVCLMHKSIGDEAAPSIFEWLDKALVAWRPNLLQLLVSEMQNELEQNSYAFDDALVPSGRLKAGWIYHTLREYGRGGDGALRGMAAGLNVRLAEALERMIEAELADDGSTLMRFSQEAAKLSIQNLDAFKGAQELDVAKAAAEQAGLPFHVGTDNEIVHALNEYLSSDRFRGGHVTTGTVLCSADQKDWWLCVTPSCDMVPRKSKDVLSWQAGMHPMRPVNLLRLQDVKAKKSLAEAEKGVEVYLTVAGKPLYLRAVDTATRMPRPVTCLLEDSVLPGGQDWQRHGFVVHEPATGDDGPVLRRREVYAMAQLRPAYAARFMHLAGSHQSRIGVDYVPYGDAADEEVAGRAGEGAA